MTSILEIMVTVSCKVLSMSDNFLNRGERKMFAVKRQVNV